MLASGIACASACESAAICRQFKLDVKGFWPQGSTVLIGRLPKTFPLFPFRLLYVSFCTVLAGLYRPWCRAVFDCRCRVNLGQSWTLSTGGLHDENVERSKTRTCSHEEYRSRKTRNRKDGELFGELNVYFALLHYWVPGYSDVKQPFKKPRGRISRNKKGYENRSSRSSSNS
ncbi:uncharacterized protein IWZ02DRAFT_284098 [Phyllosticta citriasiana]|uniref:uncharacterized protein n=1 Tax=Phyllosticta citriasiana TaxID=595635 RepID=UPI0030FDEC43